VPAALDALAATDAYRVDGVVSIWCAPAATPATAAFARAEHAPHYAASTMKVALMLAAHRLVDAGELDLDEAVEVHDRFTSGFGGDFTVDEHDDSDPQVWARRGERVPLRWLVERSIVRSSNLATNLVLERTGLAPVGAAWAVVGADGCRTERMIEDRPAAAAGRTNVVDARGLALLVGAIAAGAENPPAGTAPASPTACREMLAALYAQEFRDCVVRGLPAGTRLGHKTGSIPGVQHDVALVEPADAAAYLLAICTSTSLDGPTARGLLTRIAAASWADRHELGGARS